MFFFVEYLKDGWLPILICSDRIYPPTPYNYVVIECNSQHKICIQMKGPVAMMWQQNRNNKSVYWRFIFVQFFSNHLQVFVDKEPYSSISNITSIFSWQRRYIPSMFNMIFYSMENLQMILMDAYMLKQLKVMLYIM